MSQLYRTLTGQSQRSHHSGHSTETRHSIHRTGTTLTIDPLAGVLNHLSPAQEEKLEQFKEWLQKDGWWTPPGPNGKASHDDATLLRYLRARKFDVSGAIGQFTDTEKWLKEHRVDELYEHFDVEAYEKARLVYPQWTGRRDRRGIPIYVFVIKELDSKNVHKYQKDSQAYKDSLPYHKTLATPAKMLPLFALYHNLLNFVLPLVSALERPNPEVPITNSTNIVDISHVGLTQFWNLKGHMQDASVLATAHYPETLDRIFIIGAPAFFPTVWGWVKRWFDPVTVSKIFILHKSEVKSTLSQFMDPQNFPKRYGGELDWEWGQLPSLDEEALQAVERDGNKGWVPGPCLWLDYQRVVVGSDNGKLRRADEEVAEKKPVVYAADYTDVPVHRDRHLSTLLKAQAAANGAAQQASTSHEHEVGEIIPVETDTAQESTVDDALLKAPAPANGAAQLASTSHEHEVGEIIPVETDTAQEATVVVVDQAPPQQEAPPQPSPTESHLPLGHSQPEPSPAPPTAAENLEVESASTIPESANGTLPQPERVKDSNLGKEITIEVEKLALSDKDPLDATNRPAIDRLVTASEA